MELGQLRALREVGDRGSIAAAAAFLRVTPSSVSQQISALQRQAAVPLTFKDGRRTVLTDAGRALAAAAVDVQVALERAQQSVARFQREPTGLVSVAAFHSAGLALFGGLLGQLATPESPRVELSDFDVAQHEFATLTADHDLVIAHRMAGSTPWPSSVHVEPLLFEPLDIALARNHRLAAQSSISPADLAGEDWVAVHEGFPLEGAIGQIAAAAGADVRISHRINEFYVTARVVAASSCVALIPRYFGDAQHDDRVVLRPLSGPPLGRHIDCLSRPEASERLNVTTVLRYLRLAADRVRAGRTGQCDRTHTGP